MATYTVVTAGQIDAESYIDTTLAGQWTNNLIASFEKAAGAPVLANDYVVEAMMADAAVDRGTLDTATVSLSGTTTGVNIDMDAYCFFPMIHMTASSSANHMEGSSIDGASADSPRFRLSAYSYKDSKSYDVDYRYITNA